MFRVENILCVFVNDISQKIINGFDSNFANSFLVPNPKSSSILMMMQPFVQKLRHFLCVFFFFANAYDVLIRDILGRNASLLSLPKKNRGLNIYFIEL